MSYEYWTETRNGGGTAVKTAKPKTAAPKPERATSGHSKRSHGRSLAQLFAAAIGAVFVLVGVLGFVPGIVRMFGDLSFIGPDSHAKLLGLFEISVVHNIVHLLFGVGVIASRKSVWAVRYLVIGGLAYLGVLVYGLFVVDSTSKLNFLPINTADNVLHLGLSLGMVALGIVGALALRRNPATA